MKLYFSIINIGTILPDLDPEIKGRGALINWPLLGSYQSFVVHKLWTVGLNDRENDHLRGDRRGPLIYEPVSVF